MVLLAHCIKKGCAKCVIFVFLLTHLFPGACSPSHHQHPFWVQVTALAFSPDGQMLASGSEDGSLMLWNLKDARRFTLAPQHKGPVWSLAYSQGDGSVLASGDLNSADLFQGLLCQCGQWRELRQDPHDVPSKAPAATCFWLSHLDAAHTSAAALGGAYILCQQK